MGSQGTMAIAGKMSGRFRSAIGGKASGPREMDIAGKNNVRR
jgi:hypothetical protein